MKLPRRQFLHLAAGATALPAVSRIAWAQTYPARSVRIVVGLTAGSASDIVARLVGQWLSERLGQQFVVENRPGAGTNIAAEAVVRSAPDGYTLLLAASPNAINASLYDKLSFNFIRDIAPVAAISREPNVVVVNPSLPTRTVPELIAYAKANPGRINMASAGNGTTSHLAGELFKMMTGAHRRDTVLAHRQALTWDPEDKERTALHEVGHAVVAWSFGITVGCIHLDIEKEGGHAQIASTAHLEHFEQIA